MRSQKTLGQILLDAGLIDEVQLKSALANQESWGGRLGHHLVKAGAITEDQLLDALSHQLGIAKINFRRSKIYRDALELVPKYVCEKYGVIPVAVKELKGHHKLLLAMSDPTNYQAIQEVEFVSGHTVVTVVAIESEIERAVRFCYHPDGLRESHGLSEIAEVIEFDAPAGFKGKEDPVIITAEGELRGVDNRISDLAFRALLDLLVSKDILSIDEFRDRIEELKKKE